MPQIMSLWRLNKMMAFDKYKVEVNTSCLTLKCMIHNVHTGRAEVSVSN